MTEGELPYVQGVREAAQFLGWSESRLKQHMRELRNAQIAYEELIGRPPNRKRVLRFWKNLLQIYRMRIGE